MTKDYYRLLQVHPDAEADVIQSAYKRLCRKYHPDVNQMPNAQAQMQGINAAYEILGDPSKRRAYHAEWLRANPTGRTAVSERVVYVQRDPITKTPDNGTPEALQAVRDYFRHLSRSQFKEAYRLLSAADTGNFTLGSFAQWQVSVGTLYQIGQIDVKLFRRHNEIRAEKVQAEEFVVTLMEKHKQTGQVSECSFSKTVVYEEGRWRVYLGYKDLSPMTVQFRSIAANQGEAQLMGIWERYKSEHDLSLGLRNALGFIREMEPEIYRHKRYASPFCLAVLRVYWPDFASGEEQRDRILRFVGYLLNENIRVIDKLGYIEQQQFVILLAEVRKPQAALALRRILKNLRQGVGSCFDFTLDVRAGLAEYSGVCFEDMVAVCQRTIEGVGAEAIGS